MFFCLEHLEFSAETAISLTFDCFSILTRVTEIHFLASFSFFAVGNIYIEICAEHFILDLVCIFYLEFSVGTIYLEASVCMIMVKLVWR